ncbi:MAG TPA: flagellar motor protein MotD [Cellvibrio sp.]|nr:flagellar motor protein MotD [Cellvibrio sp.]
MVRRRHAEVHVNQERWLVSYADFITLLFAFFVVMYSISQVNQSKYRVLSETFEHAFNSRQITTDTTSNNPIEKIINPIQVGEPALSPDPSAIDVIQENADDAMSTSSDQLLEISSLVNERFADLINDELVSIASNELWLQIELKDSILFASGGTDLSLQAQAIFDEIAGILKGYPNPIQVEGYTDNIPINNPRYPSNWELSSARASAIVKLLAARGVAPQRLSAVGFGEFQPVASNEHPAGRAQNRRVALMIARRKIERPGAPVDQQLERTREMSSPAVVEPLRNVVEEKDNQAAQQNVD